MIKSKRLPTFITLFTDRDGLDSLMFTYVFEPVTGKVIWAVKHYRWQIKLAQALAACEVMCRGCKLNVKTVANSVLEMQHPCRNVADRFGWVPELTSEVSDKEVLNDRL